MGIRRVSLSTQHGGMSDGGVRPTVFLLSLVFLEMVKFGAVEAQVVHAPASIPPPPPLTVLQQSQEAVRALRENNLTTAAQLIQTYFPILRLNSTLFVPTNQALASASAATPTLTLLLYHSVRPQYTFDQLLSLPVGTRLATALGNNSIVVTSNNRSNYMVDNVRIAVPDACASHTTQLEISCFGIEALLDVALYGKPTAVVSPAPIVLPVGAPVPTFAPLNPPVLSPPVLPSPPVVPVQSPDDISPGAQSPTKFTPTTKASGYRVNTPFKHLAYAFLLLVMNIGFGL